MKRLQSLVTLAGAYPPPPSFAIPTVARTICTLLPLVARPGVSNVCKIIIDGVRLPSVDSRMAMLLPGAHCAVNL